MGDAQSGLETVEYYPVAALADLKPGERLFLEIDDQPIVLLNLAGSIFAMGDVCSHDGGPLGDGAVEGFAIICPRHGARFDVRTGEVLALPAVEDVPVYPVRVVAGQIEIGISQV